MKLSNAELFELVEQDGLGATIQKLPDKRIEDPVLATLWADARELIDQIDEYLQENHEEWESDEEDNDSEDENNDIW